ncbi:MAG TPA: triose-phosphate isomerase [Geminicoccaceae bacterium]|nr:triose-phosphate isomerase [Geminicoccaceae bacterium]
MVFATPVVIGNWKMHGLRADGEARVRDLLARQRAQPRAGTLGVCPPATLLSPIDAILGDGAIVLGAQDCASEPKGAYTGDISAPMLKDAGCRLVIVGHSERRHGHGESDQQVRAKAEAALAAGLIAVLCIGETEDQWSAGRTLEVLDRQLEGSLPAGAAPATLILAYEPVWAIGSGRTPSLEDIGRTHGHLRARLEQQVPGGDGLRILYGGSVKAANAGEILGVDDVDGALVGGASLDPAEFWAIYAAGQAP